MCTMFSHCTPSLGSSSRSSGCASDRPRTNDRIFFSPPESVPACCSSRRSRIGKRAKNGANACQAAVGAHQRQVVAHAQVVEHRALLRAVADAERASPRRLDGVDRAPLEADAARAAPQLAEQQLQQRALADAVAADHAQHLAGRDRAVDVAHDDDLAVAADDVLELEPRRAAHFSAPT